MPSITVRNVPDEVLRALRLSAAMHGRSVEAEIRFILETAVQPDGRVKLGSLLTEVGREAQGVDLHIERDTTPGDSMSFE